MASPVFPLRLDAERRARWVLAAGGLPLGEWMKVVCDLAADQASVLDEALQEFPPKGDPHPLAALDEAIAAAPVPVVAASVIAPPKCRYPNPVRGMKCVYCHQEHPR